MITANHGIIKENQKKKKTTRSVQVEDGGIAITKTR